MAKQFFKLTHHCCVKGMEGEPDQVIEVDDAGAKFLTDRKGGFACDKDGKPLVKKEAKPEEK